MKKRFSAILCDRDGVLIDSENANVDAALGALHTLGITTQEEDMQVIMGKHPLDYVDVFVHKYHVLAADFLSLRDTLYTRFLDDVHACADVCEFLRGARSDACRTALVTSASRDNTEKLLDRLVLRDLFDVIVTFDECPERKPHPAPYIHAAHQLVMENTECLVVEDSPVGLLAAKNADMTCVIRRNVRTTGYDFSAADLVVDDARDIRTWFDLV